jgi:hypothetical protein
LCCNVGAIFIELRIHEKSMGMKCVSIELYC